MLGKDYMLAIVLVNCDDNLWSDQSLETDPDLPPGWRKICDSLGTYYWHVPTGTTQWQHPARTAGPAGHPEADGEETAQGMDYHAPMAKHSSKDRPIPSPMASLSRRTSLPWHGDDFQSAEPGSKCFAVRSLGWVEIPEEDLAPGKSSIAVNNCIQQLSNSKGQGSVENQGEGQDLVMILKKDTMSLVDPLDRSLIHRQPILNIRVWGVGCNNGRDRDFAFVASDKDTCVLKCHVFHCNVPAKGIAKALHEMCSKIVAERAVATSGLPRATMLRPMSTEDLPLQVDILEAVRQSIQTYEALYIGSLPVPRAMGMDVLNEAIEKLTRGPGREHWMPSLIHVSDTAMRVHPAQEDEDAAHIWECQVRYVTFLGVGHDAHTFALIVDTGRRFQCTAFWCEPNAGSISEAVQAACMVSWSAVPEVPGGCCPGSKSEGRGGRSLGGRGRRDNQGERGQRRGGGGRCPQAGALLLPGSLPPEASPAAHPIAGRGRGPGPKTPAPSPAPAPSPQPRSRFQSPVLPVPPQRGPAPSCPAPLRREEGAGPGVTWRHGGALREAGEPGAWLERPPPILVRAAGAGWGAQANPSHPPGPPTARGGTPRASFRPSQCPRSLCSSITPSSTGPASSGSHQPPPTRGLEAERSSKPRRVQCARRHRAGPAEGGPGCLPAQRAETSVRRHRAASDGAGGRVGSGEVVSPGEEEDEPPGARAPAAALGCG